MAVRDNVRRYSLLSAMGLSFALAPAALLAQAPARGTKQVSPPAGGDGTRTALIAAGSAIVVAIVGGFAAVAAAKIQAGKVAEATAQQKLTNYWRRPVEHGNHQCHRDDGGVRA